MLTQRERAEKIKGEIVRSWRDGGTITSISRSTGLNRNAIRALLESEGVREDRVDAKALARSARRREVLFWVRTHSGCTIADVSSAVGLPVRTVAGYLDDTPELALLVESRVKDREFTREVMLEHLRTVWSKLSEDERSRGLSKVKYDAMTRGAGEKGHPSPALFEKRFESWSGACAEAGIPPTRKTRWNYTRVYSGEDMVKAIAQYIEDTGETSFSGYVAWAQRNPGRPSGSLIITRYGRWGDARRAVIAA